MLTGKAIIRYGLAAFCLLPLPKIIAQRAAAPFAITLKDVADTLQSAGVNATRADVALVAPVSASVPSPQLRIAGREQAGDHQERLRLACVQAGACLPFYVLVRGNPETLSSEKGGATISSSMPLPPIQTRAAALRPGDRAMLLLENHFMQISLPVIVIDAGRSGSDIRVASLDRKQLFRGKLLENGAVHGDLP